MKKSHLLLGLILISMCASGCDALNNLIPNKKEEEQQQKEEEKKDQKVEPKSISVEEDEVFVKVGEYYQIVHQILPLEANQDVEYDCSDVDKITIYPDGTIYGLSVGTLTVWVISAENQEVKTELDVTVYEDVAQYSLEYNGNGGTGTVVDEKSPYEEGSMVTVKDNGFSRNGYNFKNYNTKADGSGTTYNPGDTFSIFDSTTLYAQWEAAALIYYSVTYDANGGSNTMVDPGSPYVENSEVTVLQNKFSRGGYYFTNFNTAADGSGTSYSEGAKFNINENTTLFAQWEETGDDPYAAYYANANGKTGTSLLSALNTITNGKSLDGQSVSVSYAWSRYEEADEDPNNSSNVILIYTRASVSKTAHVSGSVGWNREHTFPNSKMSGDADNDNHIIYASDNKVNGARSNIKMGVVDGGSVVKDYNGKDTSCRKTSDLFDPHNIARGIVSRTTMYAAAKYGLSPTDNFESLETLLRWHFEYWPDENDMRRNNVVYKNQHNRNPFVDHPEYACKIWGNTNSATKQICGIK